MGFQENRCDNRWTSEKDCEQPNNTWNTLKERSSSCVKLKNEWRKWKTPKRDWCCFGFNRQEIDIKRKEEVELQFLNTYAKQNNLPGERSRLPGHEVQRRWARLPMITERGGWALASCLGVYGHAAWLLLEDGSRSDPNGFNEELFTYGRGALKILQEKLCISIHLPFGR